jgi:hypothetical protein
MLNKPMPVDESRQETVATWRLPQAAVADNWLDTGLMARVPKGTLT